jgi:Protein kinase domain
MGLATHAFALAVAATVHKGGALCVQTDFCILVQDYAAHGDLYSHLRKQRLRFTEKRLVQLVMQPCLDALAYLHSKNIVHRDIKPENLLLADFGLSVSTDDENPVTRAGALLCSALFVLPRTLTPVRILLFWPPALLLRSMLAALQLAIAEHATDPTSQLCPETCKQLTQRVYRHARLHGARGARVPAQAAADRLQEARRPRVRPKGRLVVARRARVRTAHGAAAVPAPRRGGPAAGAPRLRRVLAKLCVCSAFLGAICQGQPAAVRAVLRTRR